jgi:3-hydroxyisobutyrate dehydrogenase-like beta-hydroxyacid dehydrogenase
VRNLLGYSFMVATYESLAFAESMGVDLDAFRRVLRDSDVTSQAQLVMDLPTTKPYTESEEAAAYWKNLTGLAGEELRNLLERAESVMEKDMDEITALAEETGFHMDFTGGAKPLLHHVLLLPDN